MSIFSNSPSRSPIPPPLCPYNPTACTSSIYVIPPYLCATSHILPTSQIEPSIEWTDSKATIFGISAGSALRISSKCSQSLWRKMVLGAPLLRIPFYLNIILLSMKKKIFNFFLFTWIIDAWLPESLRMWHFGNSLAMVYRVVSFAT